MKGEYLTFLIAAPLGAMGSLAVGERRDTWDRPGRSAVMGMVAACLGAERTNEQAHQALNAQYGMALRVEKCGSMLADFHTAQVPPRRKDRVFRTRREELSVNDLGAILSRRDYHTDVVVFIALWARSDAPRWSLDAIAQALREPQFAPYLGRRCCPLSLPLSPEINPAGNPVEALAERAGRDNGLRLLSMQPTANPVITLDAADARAWGLNYQRIEIRRDALASRARWQFNLREEAVI